MSRIAFLTVVLAAAACKPRGDDTTAPARAQTAPQASYEQPEPQPTPKPTPTPTPAPQQQRFSDADIAGMAATANRLEIEAGQLALNQTSDPDVQAFAQMMVSDHTAVNDQATALFERLSITPAFGDATEQMQQDADDTKATLQNLTGAEFDKAYVQQQIEMHQKVLDDLDAQLIPNAEDPELAAFLRSIRPKVAVHLEHAKALQARLSTPDKDATDTDTDLTTDGMKPKTPATPPKNDDGDDTNPVDPTRPY